MAEGEAIELSVGGRDVRVSNPAKVYFPQAPSGPITKREVVEYYVAVGPAIVQALADRPTYLQRFPDGIEGEEVYQKRMPSHAPPWLQTCEVRFPSGRSANALRVTGPADVAWAANLGCVTFHPWHARCTEVERRAAGAVTTGWWKEQRGEAVFVDYNQNARDRTIASAWSVRRRAAATVSTPVSWDDLAVVEPEDCTLRTVPALLAERGDPHEAIDEVQHSLEPLLEMAARDEAGGLEDLPYPPNYPKMPGEPKRVQPSRDRDRHS